MILRTYSSALVHARRMEDRRLKRKMGLIPLTSSPSCEPREGLSGGRLLGAKRIWPPPDNANSMVDAAYRHVT